MILLRPFKYQSLVNLDLTGYLLQRESRENSQKRILVRENTGNLDILPKHGENTGNLEILSKHREFGLLKL